MREQILFPIILIIIYIFLHVSGVLIYWYDPIWRWGTILIGVLGYYVYQTRKRYSDSHGSFWTKKSIKKRQIEHKTYYFSYHYFKNKLFCSLWLDGIYGYDFSLKKEERLELWLKAIGLNTEYQTGDESFDDLAFIVLDDEKLRSELKNNDTLRNILNDIFMLTEKSLLTNVAIQCFDGCLKLSFEKNTPKKDTQMNEETIEPLIQKFVPLLSAVKSFFPPLEEKNKSVYREKSSHVALVFYSIISMLFINGLSMIVLEAGTTSMCPRMIHPFSIIPLAMQVTLVVLVIFFIIIYLTLRRSSRLIPVIKGTLSFGVIGVFLTMVIELREINFLLDSSVSKMYVTTILDKRKSTGRHTSYTLELRDWDNSRKAYSMKVDSKMYHEARIGQAIKIIQKKGFLDFPWIKHIEISQES